MIGVLRVTAVIMVFTGLGCSSMPRAGDDIVLENSARTITVDEWKMFANQMLTSLNQSGVLARYRAETSGPVPIMIGDFRNDTDRAEFADSKNVMLDAVRKQLVNTGQAGITSDIGGTGAQIDRSIGDSMQLWESDAYDKSTLARPGQFVGPRVTLNGQFISNSFREGRTSQFDYACALRLIDNQTAETVWEEQVVFPKQFERAIFGK
jgi:PBP1b-binding outer membrane lipoprotein LpoB